MTCKDQILIWLDNAYAMEQSIVKTLEEHAEDAKGYPDLQSEIRTHIEQTHSQARRVKDLMEKMGKSPSFLKRETAEIGSVLGGLVIDLATDKVVKNCLAEYAAENFEIASYKALMAAAEQCGEGNVIMLCSEIIDEEEAMAMKLDQRLIPIVQRYIVDQGLTKES